MMNKTINGQNIVIYWDNGTQNAHVTTIFHAQIFGFLERLGIKSTPLKEQTVQWVAPSNCNYTVTYDSTTAYVTASMGITTTTTVDIAKMQEPVPAKYHDGKPDKAQRREWRTTSTKHSRNTGRKIGRR